MASGKLVAASSCWEQFHLSVSNNIQADEASARRHMSQVDVVTLTALRGATAQRMKRLRDENPPETHKRHKTEALEVPSDLQDMWIPLEDMGDVIVLTRM